MGGAPGGCPALDPGQKSLQSGPWTSTLSSQPMEPEQEEGSSAPRLLSAQPLSGKGRPRSTLLWLSLLLSAGVFSLSTFISAWLHSPASQAGKTFLQSGLSLADTAGALGAPWRLAPGSAAAVGRQSPRLQLPQAHSPPPRLHLPLMQHAGKLKKEMLKRLRRKKVGKDPRMLLKSYSCTETDHIVQAMVLSSQHSILQKGTCAWDLVETKFLFLLKWPRLLSGE